jgi:uncharacterized protein
MYHIKIDLGKLSALAPKTTVSKAMLSPCVGICQMSVAGLCEGCLRTGFEIANWTKFTDAERAHVMDVLLPERESQP